MSKKLIYSSLGVLFFIFLISSFSSPEDQVVIEPVVHQKQKTEEINKTQDDNQSLIENITVSEEETEPVVKEQPTQTQVTQEISSEPKYTYYSVLSVVDGDTVKIEINGVKETLRLIGMDTPETVDPRKPVQCFGVEASNKAKELLEGKKIRIEADPTQGERDKYGRLLVYVYREDGVFFNKYMIEQGFAHEYTYNIPYKYQTEFQSAENYARENNLGLWSPETCNGDTTTSAEQTQQETTTTPTGKYYTSEHYSAKYYYPESCSDWQNLSKSYLRDFNSIQDLLNSFPDRTLSPQCQ